MSSSSSYSGTGYPENFGVTHAYRTSQAARQCKLTGACAVTIDGNAYCSPLWVRHLVPYGATNQGYVIYNNYGAAQKREAFF